MHEHDHEHEHCNCGEGYHPHNPKEQRAVLNRLSRVIGHLESIKRMVEEGRDYREVLI